MKRDKLKIFIYGKGRVGGTLFYSLKKNNTVCFLAKSDKRVSSGYSFDKFIAEINDYDLIILSVPDGKIKEAVNRIAGAGSSVKNTVICHTSGTVSYKVLQPLEKKGFIICSLHPYFSFYREEKDIGLKNIRFTLSCRETDKNVILAVLRRAGINACFLDDNLRLPYHISAVLVSNFSAMLQRIALELLEKTGFSEDESYRFIFSLLESTLSNLKRYGIRKTITGPAARGDTRILRLHKKFLGNYNRDYLKLYKTASDIIQQIYLKG
ncbi:MAG: DUF2520 domain-containing protein [Deltaproteobacteria bacterium]|nr:DUF2520 domain-containing protein [Deltaproteobacteria bacterium]